MIARLGERSESDRSEEENKNNGKQQGYGSGSEGSS
jgi:hypothetical protein